jgi:hypothetical protein
VLERLARLMDRTAEKMAETAAAQTPIAPPMPMDGAAGMPPMGAANDPAAAAMGAALPPAGAVPMGVM